MKKALLTTLIGLSSIATLPLAHATVTTTNKTSQIDTQKILANAPTLNAHALQLAVNGYQWAQKHNHVTNPNVLTVIDFTLPSAEKRLWVIDLSSSKILLNTYTTHGKNSGLNYATHFSNDPRSNETSLGVYQTLNTYQGEHGLSLRINGLEKGVNDNALRRAVVIHPAIYATSDYVNQNHRTGRSWGCFAVSPAVSQQFINLTKNGSIIFAYAKPIEKDPNLA